MLLTILLLNLAISAGAYDKSSPKLGLEGGSENFIEKLELRLRDMEKRMQDEQDEKEKLELKLKEIPANESRLNSVFLNVVNIGPVGYTNEIFPGFNDLIFISFSG